MILTATVTNLWNGAQFTFNDDTAPTENWTMDVNLRTEDRDRPLEHGQYESYTYYGSRIFHAEGKLIGSDAGNYMQNRIALHNALILPSRAAMRAPLQLDLQFYGVNQPLRSYCTLDSYPELPMTTDYWAITDYLVSFKAFDPLIYGSQQHSAQLSAPVITTGAPFPLIFPVSFFEATGTDGLATNSGNIPTYPLFTITGPVTNPRIMNVTTGEALRFDGLVLNAGDEVTVDFKQRVAISSAGGNFYGTITSDSDFWQLAPGDTTFRYTADKAASPSTATLYWYDAYML